MLLDAVELAGLVAATWLVARSVGWVYRGNELAQEESPSRPSEWS